MIQVFVLPAMLISQIYSKTLYATQDVKTPVRTSMISLGAASILYLTLFPFVGYLAIPIGVVISGYLKNYLLGRACRERGLWKTDARTFHAVTLFSVVAAALGIALSFVPITSIWMLGVAICGYGTIYLPVAYIIDKKVR